MRKIVFSIFIISLILTGCTSSISIKQNIIKVTLVCTGQVYSEDCKDVTFDDESSIKAIEQAMKRAKPMQGAINYVAEYRMVFTFKDGTTRSYDLSLGQDREQTGLLVENSQGYVIPVKEANRLRELISSKEGRDV